VDVVELPPWNVAYIRSTGPYKGDSWLFERLWNKLAVWAGPRGLLNKPDAVYLTICHDDPEITMEEKLRVSVCMGIDETTMTSGEVGKMRLPGGKYAICRFSLGSQDYPCAWGWMYGVWLPLSGFHPDDRVAFEWIPPQKPPRGGRKISVDICIPLKIAPHS
jgi:AraC family transcriptional regulator